MDGKHRIGIAFLLAGAAAASTVGIARSVGGGDQPPVGATTTDQAIEKRQADLDRAEREIAKSLTKKPPELPAAAASSSTNASAPPVVVVTRRAAAAPTAGGSGDDDDGDDHEGGDDGDEHEGGDDD